MAEGLIGNALLIAGPTASGKSAAALDWARREGRVIVNADAMQVYDGLRILTARPGEAELAAVPHWLYGHVAPTQPYSVGAWLREVEGLHRRGAFKERPPVFVGGTGLYFRALCEGLADMPDIPPPIRETWRARLAAEGPEALHALLRRIDPDAAALLAPRDGVRVVRALEVFEATGRSIRWWRAAAGAAPLIDAASAVKLVIEPERGQLAARIGARFDHMLAEGALGEARRIGSLGLDPALPAAKVIGLRELLAAERGEIGLAEAAEQAKAATRRYAKRQSTWFRHQLGPDWRRVADAKVADLHVMRVYGP